jgi:putative FmdB family regulatory protein
MPTYEYKCTKCGRIFEEFQSITAKPLKTIACRCDECNNRAPVVRLLGAGSGIIFKGSGFYETDYRSESYKKSAKAEQEASKPATESKSDSKAAATTGKSESKSDTKGKTGQKPRAGKPGSSGGGS